MLTKKNIRTNCISLGRLFDNQPKRFVENYSKKVPVGRMANNDDIKGLAVLLASDASAYIKGENELRVYETKANLNRVSAFKAIVPVPEDFVEKFEEAKPTNRLPKEISFESLPPSGLMGPIKIISIGVQKIEY